MNNTLPLTFLFASVVAGVAVSCASQDPGAYEIVPRVDAAAPPITPTGNPTGSTPVGDGGTGDATAPVSTFFGAPYATGTAVGVIDLAMTHNGNGGPTTLDMAKVTDCTSAATCHNSMAPAGRQFLAAGVANGADLEIGVKLANGTLRTGRSYRAPNTIFAIPLTAGDNIANAKVGVRSATKESLMSGAVASGGCMQGACHGGGQGVVFK